jgi:NADPH2:quinone reductase
VERPPYEPGPDEVVVRVAVSGVNRADLFIRSGEWPQAGGWPYVPGLEACGTVERVGANVREVSPGDAVITMMQKLGGIHGTRPGGYQETICVPASTLARVPAGLPLDTAGALGLAAVTAWFALGILEVHPDQRVLVHGGSSGVGTIAIQLLRNAGAHVIATGTRAEKFDLMRRAGASEVISTRDRAWARSLGTVDRVFDLVGAATFAESVQALAPGGRLVFVGGTSGGDVAFSAWALMRPVTLTGYSSESLDRAGLQAAMNAIAEAVARGALRVIELHRFALHDAARAHAEMESGRLGGRVVLTGRSLSR